MAYWLGVSVLTLLPSNYSFGYEPENDEMGKISNILSLIRGEDDGHSVSGWSDQWWSVMVHPPLGEMVVITPICSNLTTVKYQFIKINPILMA